MEGGPFCLARSVGTNRWHHPSNNDHGLQDGKTNDRRSGHDEAERELRWTKQPTLGKIWTLQRSQPNNTPSTTMIRRNNIVVRTAAVLHALCLFCRGLSTPVSGVTIKIGFEHQWAVADLSETKSGRFTCDDSLDMVHRLRRVGDCVLVVQ